MRRVPTETDVKEMLELYQLVLTAHHIVQLGEKSFMVVREPTTDEIKGHAPLKWCHVESLEEGEEVARQNAMATVLEVFSEWPQQQQYTEVGVLRKGVVTWNETADDMLRRYENWALFIARP